MACGDPEDPCVSWFGWVLIVVWAFGLWKLVEMAIEGVRWIAT